METIQQEIARYRETYNRPKVAIGLIAGYALLLLLPLVLALAAESKTDGTFLKELGKNFALLSLTVLALQFVLSSRLPRLSHYYGLDMVLRFHKGMATFAVTLLLCHPVLIAAGENKWNLLYDLTLPWPIWLGKIALLLLIVQAVTSLFQRRLLAFEKWRLLHNQAVVIFGLVLVHSWKVGDDLKHLPLQIFWVLLTLVVASAYIYHKFYRPSISRQNPYQVKEVRQETHNVRTIIFTPPADRKPFSYLPGQFHFVKFYRGSHRYDGEEHHFTISSSPTQPGILSSTIKESGDFTSSLGETKPGDVVHIEGPFGRFSHVLTPHRKKLVFIAGGIGITPLMSMLRYMRDIRSSNKVVLLYANKTKRDIIFREELEEMVAAKQPRLRVVHILSRPGMDWRGEYGRIDQGIIRRYCGIDMYGMEFFLCCPPEMMAVMERNLKELGVGPDQIHSERFWL